MILTVAFVALLLCAEAEPVTKKISECKDWACFVPGTCLNYEGVTELQVLTQHPPVNDDCSAIIMIKPYSTKKWQVVIESWNAQANEVKLLQDSDEIFSCKKDGSKSIATSLLPDFKEDKKYSEKHLSCQFYVGDSSNDVLTAKPNAKIKLVSNGVNMEMKDSDFILDALKKTKCDVSNIRYENEASPEEVTVAADVSLEAASCHNSLYKLQYKSGDKYVDVTGGINCTGTTQTPTSDYKYVITLASGVKDEKSSFHVRCHAKACSFCTQPTTPTGKTAPVFEEKDGCKTLTCPKFFKIGDKITDDKAKCEKTDGDKFVWKIGESTVSETTAVECFEPKECKVEDAACSDDCKVDNGMPSCKNGFELSVDIKSKDVKNFKNFTIACDTMTGQLRYTEEGKGAEDLPKDAKFSCTEAKQSEEKVATGGSSGLPNPLQACIAVATVLSLLLVVLSVGLWYWRKRKNEAKAAAESKSKPEKEKGAKEKGEAMQDE